jgi:hypothetical protein
LFSLFCGSFSVTRLYSVDDRVISEWWWWMVKDKHPCLKRDSKPWSQCPSDQGLCLRLHSHWELHYWYIMEFYTVWWRCTQIFCARSHDWHNIYVNNLLSLSTLNQHFRDPVSKTLVLCSSLKWNFASKDFSAFISCASLES